MTPVRRLAAAALLSLLSLEALAASAAANAERLLELTRADRLGVPVYAQVQQMFAQRYAESRAVGKQATLERYQAQANTLMDRAIGWENVKPEVIALYTKAFSEQELADMVAFCETPSGRKMLERLPVLNMQTAQLTQNRIGTVAPEVNQLLEAMSAELKP